MALPSSYRLDDGQPIITGVQLRVIPDAPYNSIELQRTSDKVAGGAATSAWASIAEWERAPRIGVTYLDVLPRDHGLRFYQARAKSEGFDASAWTAATTGHTPVRFTADELREQQQQYPLVAGNPAGNQATSDIYLPTGVKLKVGTTGTASSLGKQLVLGYAGFVNVQNTTPYPAPALSSGCLTKGVVSGPQQYIQSLDLPLGVVLSTSFTVTGYQAASSHTGQARIDYAPSTDPSAVTTFLVSNWAPLSSVMGWFESNYTVGGPHIVSSCYCYSMVVTLDQSTAIDSPAFQRAVLGYAMASYDQTR